jgi:crotonobetainyl-CoA:carnitine CoA-transferase CaiB-like acyl-CoA transferase
MLSPYRVLDLTDHRGELAGMILGDLGADVIRVEPPTGSDARRRGPLLASAPEGERSFQFRAFNRNKRSLALDLADEAERPRFLELVAGADFVLESGPPGELARGGLDFAALRDANPRIVYVQVTPFGSDGPYADFPAADLTIAALGGQMAVQGVAERAPVRVSVPQVWRHTGAEAAAAALVAHARMLRTGAAQRVDVSAQAAMTWTLMNAMGAAGVHQDFNRMGSMLQLGVITLPCVFACKDGFVVAATNGAALPRMIAWLLETGAVDASWAEEDWTTYESRLLSGQAVAKPPGDIFGSTIEFLMARTKAELLQGGLERGITLAPVNTVPDLLAFDHLAARGTWEQRELPDGRSVRSPGAFASATRTPLRTRRASPGLDEHGDEIRAELVSGPRAPAAAPAADGAELPFAGLKIADLTWVVAGPATTRYMVDHGATVVRVESNAKPCATRVAGPYKDGVPGLNRSHFYGDFNAGKLGITLDLKQEAGVDAVRRLIGWADVYIENFRPGVLDRLGLGYETARELNPSVVMLSTSLMGSRGPARHLAGFGYHAGALAGYYEVTGWPDLPPDGPWLAYTDTIAPRFQVAALIGALDHRRRTGQGQHIEFAQLEASLHFLAPEILNVEAGGAAPTRLGNRALDAAPQGAYPCAGADRWCAIAVETDAQWAALRAALGDPEWARAAALETTAGRLAAHDAIDEHIAAWTREREPRKVMETLVAAGVPAGVVQRSSDLLVDPQYRHRGFWRQYEHPEIGPAPYAGTQFRIEGYDAGARARDPLFNEHTVEVLSEILGLNDHEIGAGLATGAFG